MKLYIKKLLRENLEPLKPKIKLDDETKNMVGDLIGSGKDHFIFQHKNDSKKIIKVAFDGEDGNKWGPSDKVQTNLDTSHIEAFQNNPNLFAKVYEVNDRYAIIDKLKTDTIRDDQNEIFNILGQVNHPDLDYMTKDTAIERLYWVSANRRGFIDKLVRKLVKTGLFFQSAKVQLYIDFIRRIIESPLGKKMKNLDITNNNIGYDANGRLKLLDF